MDIAIGIYPQKRNCNTFIETYIKLELPILKNEHTGVLRRTRSITRGFRISPMVVRTTAVRASPTMCVLFGLFNYLIIYQFTEAVLGVPILQISMGVLSFLY